MMMAQQKSPDMEYLRRRLCSFDSFAKFGMKGTFIGLFKKQKL